MTNSEKTITLKDLQPGDIMVMQGNQSYSWDSLSLDDVLIKAIMWLTDSDVCHGAIFGGLDGDDYYLIDDGMKGVDAHQVSTDTSNTDLWYIRRLKGTSNLAPVLARANYYKNSEHTAYDWELLTMLGLLLIYKRITPNTEFFDTLLPLLKKMVYILDRETHKETTDYFVCSQFVAACFDQAGNNYQLIVKHGNLESGSSDNASSIFDHLSMSSEAALTAAANTPIAPIEYDDLGQDIKAVYQALNSQSGNAAQMPDSIKTLSIQFLKCFARLNAGALSISPDELNSPAALLKLARDYQAVFVTPADLKSHCVNFEALGQLKLKYHNANLNT